MKNSTDMAARLVEKLKTDSGEQGRAERASGAGGPTKTTNRDFGTADEAAPDAPSTSHAKMATKPNAPPGIELDEHGGAIPLPERTLHHRAEAEAAKP